MFGGFVTTKAPGVWGIALGNGDSMSAGSSDIRAHLKADAGGARNPGAQARILGNAAGVDPSLSQPWLHSRPRLR
jgi:hypothetical protein